jgi:hypothetical protein
VRRGRDAASRGESGVVVATGLMRYRLDPGKAAEVGVEDAALEGEVGEFACALDADEAGGLEFADVVRERGGADFVDGVQAGAGHGRGAGANFLEDPHAARLSQSAGDEGKPAIGEAGGLGDGHEIMIRPGGGKCSGEEMGPAGVEPATFALRGRGSAD